MMSDLWPSSKPSPRLCPPDWVQCFAWTAGVCDGCGLPGAIFWPPSETDDIEAVLCLACMKEETDRRAAG
jgi:hypothetical protein